MSDIFHNDAITSQWQDRLWEHADDGWYDDHDLHPGPSSHGQRLPEPVLQHQSVASEFVQADMAVWSAVARDAALRDLNWGLAYFWLRLRVSALNSAKAPGEVRLLMPSQSVFKRMLKSAREKLRN
ncbi:hypothetical protein ASC97_31920 [Rhizobium sp. Root1203]|uniref:hypothetical protein n=1 Tax=Rhizobium sp. Root1203 TaxID=1736427 RepID=UPI0007111DAC|nr:hypothetical protein [Rhizobium sp. Root1203]KQV13717.1 hypothetical protein ASC97_31920 [Rhizobium sp. Root1203]